LGAQVASVCAGWRKGCASRYTALALTRAVTSASFAPVTMAASTTKPRRKQFDGPSPEEAMVRDLIELLEAGTTPWRKPWDCRGGGIHINLLSGRAYRGGNPILLELGMAMRGAELPFWCGFAEAKKLGIFPRKGTRSVRILRPQLHSREEEAESGEKELRSWASYRPVPVFNVCDLEGEALAGLIAARMPEAEAAAVIKPIVAAEQVLSAWPVPVSWGGERACYSPSRDAIQLPGRESFHGAAALYATWGHEAVHSTGHESRLKRDLAGGFGSSSYAREELVAELGSVLLGQRLQIGCALTNHAAYLQSWISCLRESPKMLLQIVSEARQAVDLICPDAPAPDQEPEAAAAVAEAIAA
jgi:antirestriction protein ArdC